MNIQEAIKMAEQWTKDLRQDDGNEFFHMVRALLDHIQLQNKDIEELSDALRIIFRRNRELLDELNRS